MQTQKRRWNLRRNWSEQGAFQDGALALAACNQHQFLAAEDGFDAHGDRLFRHPRLAAKVRFIRFSRRLRQIKTVRPAGARRSGLVEGDVTVAANAQDRQVQPAVLGDDAVIIIAMPRVKAMRRRHIGILQQILLEKMMKGHALIRGIHVLIQLEPKRPTPIQVAHLRIRRKQFVASQRRSARGQSKATRRFFPQLLYDHFRELMAQCFV